MEALLPFFMSKFNDNKLLLSISSYFLANTKNLGNCIFKSGTFILSYALWPSISILIVRGIGFCAVREPIFFTAASTLFASALMLPSCEIVVSIGISSDVSVSSVIAISLISLLAASMVTGSTVVVLGSILSDFSR